MSIMSRTQTASNAIGRAREHTLQQMLINKKCTGMKIVKKSEHTTESIMLKTQIDVKNTLLPVESTPRQIVTTPNTVKDITPLLESAG